MSKTTAIISWKGGVGKTTSAVNISSYIKMQNKRVCVVDLDPQHSMSKHLGIFPGHLKNRPTMYDLLNAAIPKRNDKNQIIRNDKGEIQLNYELNFGYGCLKTVYKDKKLTQYTDFTELVTEEKRQAILKELKSPDINFEECIFTVWDESKKDIVAIVGDVPETFAEYSKRECADKSA